MYKTKIMSATVLALSAFTAQAQSYVEIGVGTAKYSETGLTATPTVVRGIYGQNLNDNFDLEVMIATGINSGTAKYSGVNIDIAVDNAFGVYVKPKVKVGDGLELFARAGFTEANITGSARGYSISQTGNSLSFGGGLKYNLGGGSYLSADYMSYYSKNGVDVNGVTVNYGFSF